MYLYRESIEGEFEKHGTIIMEPCGERDNASVTIDYYSEWSGSGTEKKSITLCKPDHKISSIWKDPKSRAVCLEGFTYSD